MCQLFSNVVLVVLELEGATLNPCSLLVHAALSLWKAFQQITQGVRQVVSFLSGNIIVTSACMCSMFSFTRCPDIFSSFYGYRDLKIWTAESSEVRIYSALLKLWSSFFVFLFLPFLFYFFFLKSDVICGCNVLQPGGGLLTPCVVYFERPEYAAVAFYNRQGTTTPLSIN